ncbi:MAG: hypothetical protein IJA89_01815 [Clostridia bacterium]|nr:hypothetical protein [Clostridia bacterium]
MKKSISLTLAMLMACSLFVGCKDHEHTYADEWKSDATKHWRESTCDEEDDCGDAITDIDGHVDANKDGACDVCAYVVCAHEYATEWSFDATNHWHAATCGCDVKKDEAAHTANAAGVACSVCGASMTPDVSDVAKALAVATAQKSNVVGGEIAIPREENSGLVTYEFGNSYLHVTDTVGTYVDEYYYSLDANGDLFAVTVDGDGNVINYGAVNAINEVKYLEGYYFAMLSGYIGEAYGVEDLLNVLYEIGVDDANGDFVATVTEGVYSYSFMYYYEGDLMDVSVSFELNESNYAVEKANVSVDVYGTIHFDDEWNAIPNYQETEAGSGVYELLEGAEGSNYTYEITQEFESVVENPYVADDLLITSFKAVDAQGNEIGDEVTVKRSMDGNLYYTYIYLAEVLPETAVIGLNAMNVSGEAIDDLKLFASFTTDDYGVPCLSLNSVEVGEYDIVVSVNGIEKALTVKVEQPAPTEINAIRWTFVEEWDDWYSEYIDVLQSSPVSEIVAVVGEDVYVGTTVDYGDSAYTATSATEDLLTAETLSDDAYNEAEAYQVDTSVAGEYEITFTSTAASTVTATLKVTVIDMADVLNGEYRYQEDGVNVYKVAFTPNADGATEGTFDMTYQFCEDSEWKAYSAKYAYAWTVEDGFEVSLVNGYDFDETISIVAGKVCVASYELEEVTEENALFGLWADRNAQGLTLAFNADGTGVFTATEYNAWDDELFTFVQKNATLYFTYTVADDGTIAFAQDTSKTNEGDEIEGVFKYTDTTTFAYMQIGFDYSTYTPIYGWAFELNYTAYENFVGEEAYAWPVELSLDQPTNVYTGLYSELDSAKELFINAEQAGTYTVSVCQWGERAPIATLDEYYFVVNDMKVVGALTFEVEEAKRINLAFMFVNQGGDFDIYVDFVAAPTDDDDDDQGGSGSVIANSAAFTVTQDEQSKALQGEYVYTIDDSGNITVYNNGIIDDRFTITYVSGTLTYNRTPLTKTTADTDVLAGTWVMTGFYEISFAEIVEASTLTVTQDEQSKALQGEYTWTIDGDGKVTVYNGGIIDDRFTITYVTGTLTYNRTPLTKTTADTDVLAGTWVMTGFYEITFTGTGAGSTVGGGSVDEENNSAQTAEVTLSYDESAEGYVGMANVNLDAATTYTISIEVTSGTAASIAVQVDTSRDMLMDSNGWTVQMSTGLGPVTYITFMAAADATFTVTVTPVEA